VLIGIATPSEPIERKKTKSTEPLATPDDYAQLLLTTAVSSLLTQRTGTGVGA